MLFKCPDLGTVGRTPCLYHRRENDFKSSLVGFPGGAVVESLPASAGDAGSSPGLGRSHMPRSD